ncbi:MAG: hypothetical protein Pars2KO_13380 [Parasphingorhabdus sp.]
MDDAKQPGFSETGGTEMENLRNNDGMSDVGGDSGPSYVAYEEEDSAIEAPPAIGQDERRMHVRAYNFWAGLLEDRQFPSVEDLNPETDDDFGPNSVLLDFTDGVENPTIQFLGQALRAECDIDESIKSVDDVPARSLLSRITDHYLQIIANQAPIGFEAEFVNQRGITIMYRGILLPFSTDDDNIDFIYGVINWKEVADDEIVQEIQEQVVEEMRSAVENVETGPVWADGPSAEQIDDYSPLLSKPLINSVSEENIAEQPSDNASLADWLSVARNSADEAAQCEQRSRSALYAAISQAYDFYLISQSRTEEYQQILDDCRMAVQERAPMTPVVKLVFGIHYDKTRLTEYASALRYAEQNNIEQGAFAEYLAGYDGGLKAIVATERASRRNSDDGTTTIVKDDDVLERLRSAPTKNLSDISAGDDEFIVLVARKDKDGLLSIVGPVDANSKLTTQILKKTRLS